MTIEVRKQKPTSAGRRSLITVRNTELYKGEPYKPLLAPLKSKGGRNNLGRVTVRHQGGGHKKSYREIDFVRNKDGIQAKVERIEYDPNRSAYIALVLYKDGERRYIIASKNMKVNDIIENGVAAPIASGNCLPMTNIPVGSTIHCVEMRPGKGAQIARSAGASVQLLAREGSYATVKLRSGEKRKILASCRAVIGVVSKEEHSLAQIGKAGRKRWLGVRPTVRGVAMNPVDHPLGGGEGRTSGGRPACSFTGAPEGRKTRAKKARSNKFIIQRRKNKSEK